MAPACAIVMETMRRIRGDFVQILCKGREGHGNRPERERQKECGGTRQKSGIESGNALFLQKAGSRSLRQKLLEFLAVYRSIGAFWSGKGFVFGRYRRSKTEIGAEGYVNRLRVFGKGFGSSAERGIARKVFPRNSCFPHQFRPD